MIELIINIQSLSRNITWYIWHLTRSATYMYSGSSRYYYLERKTQIYNSRVEEEEHPQLNSTLLYCQVNCLRSLSHCSSNCYPRQLLSLSLSLLLLLLLLTFAHVFFPFIYSLISNQISSEWWELKNMRFFFLKKEQVNSSWVNL
jgi:hypothetical protein